MSFVILLSEVTQAADRPPCAAKTSSDLRCSTVDVLRPQPRRFFLFTLRLVLASSHPTDVAYGETLLKKPDTAMYQRAKELWARPLHS